MQLWCGIWASQTYKNKMLLTWISKRDLKDLLLVEALN